MSSASVYAPNLPKADRRKTVQEFLTTQNGFRLATSGGGVVTGRGGDLIIIDDPLKPDEALSETQRNAANKCTLLPAHSTTTHNARIRKVVIS